jgi:hypothetical protein
MGGSDSPIYDPLVVRAMADGAYSSPKLGLILGAALIVIGVVASAATQFAHWTSMIPAIFGVLLVAMGLWGRNVERQRTATWAIGIVGLLGALGSVRSIGAWVQLVQGEDINLVATLAQTLVLVIGVVLAAFAARDITSNKQPDE